MALLKSDEIKYIATEIKDSIKGVDQTHFQWYMNSTEVTDYVEEYPGWTESWIVRRVKVIYTLILAYLEALEMPLLFQFFKEEFHNTLSDEKEILKIEFDHPEDGAPELLILNRYKRFLYPFKFFDYENNKEDELTKISILLKNTDYIIKKSNSVINNEADIYQVVKWVLSLYYPTCRSKNKASFIQEFKSYNPDILIPEIKTAVEFKYIRTKFGNVEEYIDQLRVDAANYTDDHRYEHFIAVVYLQSSTIATPQSIEVAWKSKKFPNNWELIVANGSSSINKKSKSK